MGSHSDLDKDLIWFTRFRTWLGEVENRQVWQPDARRAYQEWCESTGLKPRSKNGFGHTITAMGIGRAYINHKKYYVSGWRQIAIAFSEIDE